jgi:hypothetical protein
MNSSPATPEFTAHCVTCGSELHPERARKYDYCMAPECQQKNLKGLTMVAVGMNKAAEEFLILDDRTREDLASGRYRDQRRGLFGPQAPAPKSAAQPQPAAQSKPAAQPQPGVQGETGAQPAAQPRTAAQPAPAKRARTHTPARNQRPARPAWTRSQEKLALLYNEQGLRPAEIAARLGVSSHLVTQIILAARNRGKA